jgi:hypothetical protein
MAEGTKERQRKKERERNAPAARSPLNYAPSLRMVSLSRMSTFLGLQATTSARESLSEHTTAHTPCLYAHTGARGGEGAHGTFCSHAGRVDAQVT